MPHIHKRYDFAVSAFIVFNETVLLVNHPKYSKWLPVGGHVELDEDPEAALHREIAEECGLDVEILADEPPQFSETRFIIAPDYLEVHPAGLPHEHIALVYFARAKNNQSVLSDEHTDMHWFSLADLDDPQYNLLPSIKFYIQKALEKAKA
jgi:8-oxo-dGTP pyrophosphatase MutT (NUDIX family)